MVRARQPRRPDDHQHRDVGDRRRRRLQDGYSGGRRRAAHPPSVAPGPDPSSRRSALPADVRDGPRRARADARRENRGRPTPSSASSATAKRSLSSRARVRGWGRGLALPRRGHGVIGSCDSCKSGNSAVSVTLTGRAGARPPPTSTPRPRRSDSDAPVNTFASTPRIRRPRAARGGLLQAIFDREGIACEVFDQGNRPRRRPGATAGLG